MNLVPRLDADERARGALPRARRRRRRLGRMEPPRFPLEPLPGRARRAGAARRAGSATSSRCATPRAPSGRWSRRCAQARRRRELADMLFAAATDHRYLDGGHTLDFVNKALEALDVARLGARRGRARVAAGAARRSPSGWRRRTRGGTRSTSSRCSRARSSGCPRRWPRHRRGGWDGRARARRDRARRRTGRRSSRRCSRRCARARPRSSSPRRSRSRPRRGSPASRRRNEFGDWDTALHTFTFANAVEQGLRRSPSPELLRGVLDAAMSVHLDRFLNVPATRLPKPEPDDPDALLAELPRAARPPAAGRRGRAARRVLPRRGRRPGSAWSRRSARACCARTATSTRSSASRRRCASTSCSRAPTRRAAADRRRALPGRACADRRARSGRRSRSRAASTAASGSTRTSRRGSRRAGRRAWRRLCAARPPALTSSNVPRAARMSSGTGIELALVVPRLSIPGGRATGRGPPAASVGPGVGSPLPELLPPSSSRPLPLPDPLPVRCRGACRSSRPRSRR